MRPPVTIPGEFGRGCLHEPQQDNIQHHEKLAQVDHLCGPDSIADAADWLDIASKAGSAVPQQAAVAFCLRPR